MNMCAVQKGIAFTLLKRCTCVYIYIYLNMYKKGIYIYMYMCAVNKVFI